MIQKGDKLIIVAEALENENNGTVYVKLTSDSQSHMTMLTENCIVVTKPKPKCSGADDSNYFARYYKGYNQALKDCGVLEDDSN